MTRLIASLIVALTALGSADVDEQRLPWWKWGPKPIVAGGGDLASKPLFDWDAHATFAGGIRMPASSDFDYAGWGLTYYNSSGTDTLFTTVLEGGSPEMKVGQVDIPAFTVTTNTALMNRATVLQSVQDIIHGHTAEITNNGELALSVYRQWGLLVYNGRLCGTAYFYYDGGGGQRESHFCHGLTLATDTFEGWHAVWDEGLARYTAGPMVDVPTYAQTALGGPVLTLAAGWSAILAGASVGHAAFAFNPNDLVGTTKLEVAGTPLMYFNLANPQQENNKNPCLDVGNNPHPDCPDDPSAIWNPHTVVGGAFIPEGYRSLVLLGMHSDGDYCYGTGTDNPALHDTPLPPPNELQSYCYDPRNPAQGSHATEVPPSTKGDKYYWWAYDLLDLAAVKAGTKLHYEVMPYDYGEVVFPIVPSAVHQLRIQGIGYDRATKRIFVPQFRMHDDSKPVVWKVTHP